MPKRLELRAGAYITNGTHLYYIVRRRVNDLHIEDCNDTLDMPLVIRQPKDFRGWRNVEPNADAGL